MKPSSPLSDAFSVVLRKYLSPSEPHGILSSLLAAVSLLGSMPGLADVCAAGGGVEGRFPPRFTHFSQTPGRRHLCSSHQGTLASSSKLGGAHRALCALEMRAWLTLRPGIAPPPLVFTKPRRDLP